ncbi:hypothetical protein ABIE41_004732 [Bosea sp. OAE506]|uniref:hypothetical protein n=1 Tax=Bosea sp. OAE506 TaxID=2663870 RepID=UPI001A0AEFE3
MIKTFSGFAIAGLMAGFLAAPAQAQTAERVERSMERGLKRATTGEPARINKAMTQAQARRACQSEMRGSGESGSSIRTKMRFCMNQKMQGN